MKKKQKIWQYLLSALAGSLFTLIIVFGVADGSARLNFRPAAVETPILSTFENNIGVIWEKYKGPAKFNAYAVMMKRGSDFTDADLAIGVQPIYVPKKDLQYTFLNLAPDNYYFKVGVGIYKNNQFRSYGNFSKTVSFKMNSIF